MKIGEIIIIKNKKGAQMYVDEGVAEYYNDNSKIKESKPIETKEPTTIEEIDKSIKELKIEKAQLSRTKVEDKIRAIDLLDEIVKLTNLKKRLIKSLEKEERRNKIDKANSLFVEFGKRYNIYLVLKEKKVNYILYDKITKCYYEKDEPSIKSFIYITLINNYTTPEAIAEMLGVDPDRDLDNKLFKLFIEERRIKVIENTLFRPIDKKEITEEGRLFFNTYETPKLLKLNTLEVQNVNDNSFPNIKKLLLNLCCNDSKGVDWLIKRLALVVQKPTLRCPTYIVLQGRSGSGKGTFIDLVLNQIWGSRYVIETNTQNGSNNFNSQRKESIWTIFDEQQSNNKGKGDLNSFIKKETGSKVKELEHKGKDIQIIESFENFIFCSNKTDLGLKLEKGDRRASIFGFSDTLGGSHEKANALRTIFDVEIPLELSNFVSYMMHLKFDQGEVMRPYENESRENLISISMNNFDLFDEFLHNIFNGKHTKDKDSNTSENTLFSLHFNKLLIKNSSGLYLSSSKLYLIYLKYCESKNLNPIREKTFYADFYNKTGIVKDKTSSGERKRVNINGFRHDVFNPNSFLTYYKMLGSIEEEVNKNYSKDDMSEITEDMRF